MLNIYYGRESIDKERFLIDGLKSNRKTFIIVPEQFTVEAEKKLLNSIEDIGSSDAEMIIMNGLGLNSLMEIQVLSMTRLGNLLMSTLGGYRQTLIDKYGRHILLSKVAMENKENLKVFRGLEEKNSFINEVNDFISNVKLNNKGTHDIEQLIDKLEEDSYSRKKLEDLNLLFKAYENGIKGKYTDQEDYMNMVLTKISESVILKDSEIWLYGFENITKKNILIIGQLLTVAKNVNVIMTYDDENPKDMELFQLSESLIGRLKEEAVSVGEKWNVKKIPDSYKVTDKRPEIIHIEKNLYSLPAEVFQAKGDDGLKELKNAVVLVEAANFYNEAETAASYVLHLVRDKGLKFKEIRLILNDQPHGTSVVKRAFKEYGIDVVSDEKTDIMQNPIVQYVLSLMEIIVEKYRTDLVIFNLKLGFSNIEFRDVLELENYVTKYNIKGTMWKKPFKKGVLEYGAEAFEALEVLRINAMKPFLDFQEKVCTKETVGQFIDALYKFLYEEIQLPDKINEFIQLQEEKGRLDLAEETSQIWNSIVNIFDEIKTLFKEEELKLRELLEIIKIGLDKVEIGKIPPHVDSLLLGTTQRSRLGDVKALIVMGANEGMLPKDTPEETLFLDDEKEVFKEHGIEILTPTEISNKESKLGVYRSLSKPTEIIYMSYSTGNEKGEAFNPSNVFLKMKEIFPQVQIKEDILNGNRSRELVNGNLSGMRHLVEKLKDKKRGESLTRDWQDAFLWLKENKKEKTSKILKAMEFTNEVKPLNKDIAKDLYMKEGDNLLSISPSKIETYGKCPFQYFINYGLNPEEKRMFQVEPREIGDIYHRSLKKFIETLSTDKDCIRLNKETLISLSEEDVNKLIEEILMEEAKFYKEGVFTQGNEENYRVHRILEVIKKTAWVLVEQIKTGEIEEIFLEAGFGRNRIFKEIPINVSGENLIIEGQIDRVDILPSGRVKIIDYKTGDEDFKKHEAIGGVRLQLMLYLKAATCGEKKPAGVFYFTIKEPGKEKITSDKPALDAMKKSLINSFKMKGILVKDEEVINQITGEEDGYSSVTSLVQKKKDGTYKENSNLIDEEEFNLLIEQVDEKVQDLCKRLIKGEIPIFPAKYSDKTPCTYCKFKGICLFDREFKGCRWNII